MAYDNLTGNRSGSYNENDSSQKFVNPFIPFYESNSESQYSSAPTPQLNNIQSKESAQQNIETSAPTKGKVPEINGNPRDLIVNNVSNSEPPSPFIFTPQPDNIQSNTNIQSHPETSVPAKKIEIEISDGLRDSTVSSMCTPPTRNEFVPQQQALMQQQVYTNANAQSCPETPVPAKGRRIEISGDPSDSSTSSMSAAAMGNGNGFAPQQQALTQQQAYANMSAQYGFPTQYNYPAQQPPAPVYQRQPVTTVVNKSDAGTSRSKKSHEIIVSDNENKMYLRKGSLIDKRNFSDTIVNGGQNSFFQNNTLIRKTNRQKNLPNGHKI